MPTSDLPILPRPMKPCFLLTLLHSLFDLLLLGLHSRQELSPSHTTLDIAVQIPQPCIPARKRKTTLHDTHTRYRTTAKHHLQMVRLLLQMPVDMLRSMLCAVYFDRNGAWYKGNLPKDRAC